MNSKLFQEHENRFQVGDLVCYRQPSGRRKLCGIITEMNETSDSANRGELVKIYWCIDKEEVDISPLSFPPVRKSGWIAAGLLQCAGNLEIISKKYLTIKDKSGNMEQ